nr:RNA polymerase factor sigma-32 [Desulfobulbaceae bacterium]
MQNMEVTATEAYNSKPSFPANYNGVNHYLKEISCHRLLSTEETEALALRVYNYDDDYAGSQLVIANLRLVVKVVMDFQKYWMNNFLDLIQEGNVGLTKAVKKFDPHRGVKFSSYAAYWIRAYILKSIMDNWRLVRIGTTQAQRKLFYRLNKEKKLLESQGISPDSALLAERLDVKEKEIVEMERRLDNYDLSLESPVGPNSELDQKSFLPSESPGVEEIVADSEFIEWLHKEIGILEKTLSLREQVILAERLLSHEPRTLNDIAEQFGISRERVRQVEIGLLEKIKDIVKEEVVLH